MLRFNFNTFMIRERNLRLYRADLDLACEDKRLVDFLILIVLTCWKNRFSTDFYVEISFTAVPASEKTKIPNNFPINTNDNTNDTNNKSFISTNDNNNISNTNNNAKRASNNSFINTDISLNNSTNKLANPNDNVSNTNASTNALWADLSPKGDGSLCFWEEKAFKEAKSYHAEKKSKVEKGGWLTKRGHTFKNWKRRWFVLKDPVLAYFKSPRVCLWLLQRRAQLLHWCWILSRDTSWSIEI